LGGRGEHAAVFGCRPEVGRNAQRRRPPSRAVRPRGISARLVGERCCIASGGDWVESDGHADSVGLFDDAVHGALGIAAGVVVPRSPGRARLRWRVCAGTPSLQRRAPALASALYRGKSVDRLGDCPDDLQPHPCEDQCHRSEGERLIAGTAHGCRPRFLPGPAAEVPRDPGGFATFLG